MKQSGSWQNDAFIFKAFLNRNNDNDIYYLKSCFVNMCEFVNHDTCAYKIEM